MFESEIIIKRESFGWVLPAGLTKKATTQLECVLNCYGFVIEHSDSTSNIEFSRAIVRIYDHPLACNVSQNLENMESLTFVVFNGDHRNQEQVEFKYTVIGEDTIDAEELIDSIAENELKKKKYMDGVERRISVFTSQGGELKSGISLNYPEGKKVSNILKV